MDEKQLTFRNYISMLSKLPAHILREIYYYRWLRSITAVNKEYHDIVSTDDFDGSIIVLHTKYDIYSGKNRRFQRRQLDNSKRELYNYNSLDFDEFDLTLGYDGQFIDNNRKDNWITISYNYIYSSGLNDIYGYKESSIDVFGYSSGLWMVDIKSRAKKT